MSNATLEQDLIALERQFWSSKPEAYLQNADDGCLVAFPQMAKVMSREEMAGMAQEGRWSDVTIDKRGLVALTEKVAILTYEASAKGVDGQLYHALVSSAYAKRNGNWKLAFHQQTPLQDADG